METAGSVSLVLVSARLGYEVLKSCAGIARAAAVRSYEDKPPASSSPEDLRTVSLGPLPSARDLVSEVQAQGADAARARLQDFLQRARTATLLTNCVTETLEGAAEADIQALAQLQPQERKRLPLCGLPISVKECFEVKGTDSTGGLSRYRGQPLQQDSVLVCALRQAGAVPFCKTNVPQLLLSWECSNPAFGTTSHPLHRHFIPGGSSGGEACLIAQGGSLLGLGTDIGGSCRIPAALSGCVGIKPTKNRLPGRGRMRVADTPCWDGQQIVAGCPGVLARTVDDAALFFEAVLSPEVLGTSSRLDSQQVPLPWDPAAASATGRLRFGFYEEDGFISVCPAVRRAVREAAEKLRALGHEVVPFTPPAADQAWEIFVGLMGSGIDWQMKEVEGEALSEFISASVRAHRMPRWALQSVAVALRRFAPAIAATMRQFGAKSTTDYYRLVSAAQRYKTRFQDAMDAAGVDLLLCPCQPLPAQPRCSTTNFAMAAVYTAMFNVLDYAAGTLPVTELRPTDVWSSLEPVRDMVVDRASRAAYASALATGCPFPVAVQVVARPYREELLLRGLREVERATGGPFKSAGPRSAL